MVYAEPWSTARVINVCSSVCWSVRKAGGRGRLALRGPRLGAPPHVGSEGGGHAPEGFEQLTRPDLSSQLAPTRLCHCSFSSLAGCPAPEEKNKKDGAAALSRRVNCCLSPWELLPPQTPLHDYFISPSSRRVRHQAGTGWQDTYVWW